MRTANLGRPTRRVVAGLLFAAICAPAPVWAEDEPAPEPAPASAEEVEGSEPAMPAPVERRWYHEAQRDADIAFDLVIIRPAAFVTAAAGAVLFVPAAILTAPNGKDSVKEAYERFVREPGEYFVSRPLGEF